MGDVLAAPSGETLPTMCWIRASTGHECPTCGMSRSFVAFFHGASSHTRSSFIPWGRSWRHRLPFSCSFRFSVSRSRGSRAALGSPTVRARGLTLVGVGRPSRRRRPHGGWRTRMKRCSVCHTLIQEGAPTRTCPECHQQYHASCWDGIGGVCDLRLCQSRTRGKTRAGGMSKARAGATARTCPACGG